MQVQMNIKKQVLTGLFWKFMERGGTQAIQFIVQILLARLLLPKDYGIIALITIFIALANVFVQSGFSTALIQKKEVSDKDFSSVFYLNLLVAAVLYTVLYLTAPLISNFYKEPQLILILRIMSLSLFFGVVNSIQNSIVSRRMQFKKLFHSSLGAIVVSGLTGILMAYMGLGVWALVAQQLIYTVVTTVILWFTVKWRPKLVFSLKELRSLFSFGWKITLSSLIGMVYKNFEGLIIGKVFSAETLGFFNKGKQFPSLVVSNIDGSIQSVMLPALSSHQDNISKVRGMVRRSIKTSSFIIFPMMVGLAVVAEPLIRLLLTDKWLPSVPILQIYCATFALFPIHSANLQAIYAIGRSDISLKLEIIKKTIGLAILLVSVFYGIYAIALGTVLTGLISSILNAYPNKKFLSYSYKEQFIDIFPSLILSLIMGGVIYSFHFLGLKDWGTVALQVIVGIPLYMGLAYVFKLEIFQYLLNNVKLLAEKKFKEDAKEI